MIYDQIFSLVNKNNRIQNTNIEVKDRRVVYGLNGLANIINCSKQTAHNYKKSGLIPYAQIGRKLIFDVDAVLAAITKNVKETA